MSTVFTTVDEYIAAAPSTAQPHLQSIRKLLKELIPEGIEVISYNIPGIKLGKKAVLSYAAFKKHCSFFPAPIRHPDFAQKLAPYASGAATAQFPLDKPVPEELIKELILFRLEETLKQLK